MFDCVRFLGNFSDFFETGLLWLKKYSYLAVGFGALWLGFLHNRAMKHAQRIGL
jgi:hypothetical protein